MQPKSLHNTSFDDVMHMPSFAVAEQPLSKRYQSQLFPHYIQFATIQSAQPFISKLMKTSLPKLLSACICLLLAFSTFSQTTSTTTFNYTGNIVTYTVPTGVTKLTITAKGAQGGPGFNARLGGLGASMQGEFSVTPGQVLRILVGQRGTQYGYASSGGGGSFVVNAATNTPLIVAGGGGGASAFAHGLPGVITQNGTNGNGTSKTYLDGGGGINGGGGGGSANTDKNYTPGGGGGAGFFGNGGRGLKVTGVFCFPASSEFSGGAGGNAVNGSDATSSSGCTPTYTAFSNSFISGGQAGAYGSFGGGGTVTNQSSNSSYGASGGGGGYSGGGGASGNRPGGGGGSFNAGINQVNSAGVQTGHGQVVIVAELPPPATALKFDPSLAINDNSRLNYVSVNDPFEAFQKEMTVEFWMFTPNANLPFGSVMGQGDNNATSNTVWLMHPNRNGTMTFYVNDAGTLRGTTGNITANEWHHYAAVSTAAYTKFYVDGVLVHTGDGVSNSIVNNPNSVIHIGKDVRFATRHVANGDPDNRYGTMILDELRIWSRALCQQEINANKNAEINPTGQNGLQQYYRFNQGSVNQNNSTITTLTDLSGNNRNGTLNNFTLDGTSSNWVASGSTNTGIVNAYVPPTAPIVGVNTPYCVGESRTLTNAIPGGKWASNNPAAITIDASTGLLKFISPGSTIISYTTECGGVSLWYVSANPLPTPAISGTNTICSGSTTTLTASGGATYSWNTGATTASINVSPTVTTTYTVTATSAIGCTAQASRTVTVIEKPIVTANSNSPVSSGNNLQLSASGATTYNWSGPNGFSSTLQNPVITSATTTANGTYTVTGTNANGCTNTATVNVTVLAAPATALKADGVNDYVAVNNPFTAFGKAITVEFWMNAPSKFMPFGSVMGQSTSGSDNMSTNVWLMHPNTAGGIDFLVNDAGIWRGVTVPILEGGWHHYVGVASEFGTKFYVDGVLEATGPGITTGIVNNANSILHIAKDPRHNTGRFGNLSIDEVRVWSRVLCAEEINNSKDCEINPAGQTGLQEYYRFNQGIVGSDNSTVTTLNDLSGNNRNGTLIDFALTGTNSNWAQSGFVSTANCAPYVAPVAPITGNTSLCIGSNTTLANANTGGLWSSSNTSVATINANTGVVNALSAGTTTITYRTECGAVSTVVVTVNSIPTVTLAAAGGTSACPGSSITLNATTTNGSSNQWFKDAVLINGASGVSYTATVSGSYTVVATLNGCVSTVSNEVAITIADVIKPTITCPPNQTLNLDASCNATLPDYRYLVTATDNCTASGTLTVTQSPAAGTIVNGRGALIITFTVTDASNNSSTCTMGVDKFDVTAPVINCPAPITVNNATNTCGAVVTFTRPTATDNCSGPAFNFFNSGEPNNANIAREDYIELLANGRWNDLPNANTLRSIVEVNSVINTVFTGYNRMGEFGGHTYYLSTGAASWSNSRTAAQAIGGDLASINTIAENDFLKNYLTATFGSLATWAGGYQDINDAEYVEPGNASQNFGGWKWVDGTRLGAGQINITQTAGLPSGSVFPVGVTTNTFTATDESGNIKTCSFTVTVRDVQPPVISCPANITVVATSAAGAVVNYVTPVGTDNCAGATTERIAGPASGSTFPLGTTTVTHKVTDAAGLSTQCSFTITVSGLAPVIVSPGNQTVNVAPGTCSAVVNFAATETTGIPASTITYSIPSGSTFALGSTEVTATATNVVGSSSVQFTVTVVDNEKPVITTCPVNQILNLNASCNATLPDYRNLLTASDNCTDANNLVITQSPAAGTVVNGKGALIITFTVTDASGNNSTCTMTVDKKDVTAPVITCPTPITVNNTTNTCGAVVNFINPTATDNCTEGAFTFFFNGEPNEFFNANEDYIQLYTNGTWNDLPNSSANRSIVEFNDIRSNVYANYERIGTYGGHTYYLSSVGSTWTASRSAAQAIGGDLASINTKGESEFLGNFIATRNTNAWVGGYQDKTVPGFREPGNASQNYLGWKWVDGTQLGAGQITITQTAGLPSGSVFPVGITTNTFIARDESGNESTCSFTVTVRDVQAPVISCPANINVTATSAAGAVVNYTTPVGTDNCSGATTTRIAGLTSGSTFPIGTTTVTYRVTDAAGLTNQCSFTVTVVGVAPVITCPANITVNAAAGTCTANVNFAATETTGIPASTITYTINGNPVVSGASFPVGTTTVVATATNAVGSSSCSFTVTVVDNQNPTITAPANVQGNNTPGLCTGTVTLGTPVTADNCGVASVDSDAPSIFPVGSTTVTWTVTDIHGNIATATQTVVIVDNEKPTISTSNVTVSNDAAKCGATVTIAQPATGDNCGVLAVMGIRSDNELLTADYPVGTTTITWTVRDLSGNINTTTQTVVVNDTELPVVNARNIIVQLAANGQVAITPAQINNGSTDNCAIASVTLSKMNFDCSNVGDNTVVLTVTDIHGNSATANATVTVQDNIAPTVITKPVTVTLVNGSASITAAQVNNGSFDNCGIMTMTVSPANFNCNNIGSNSVTLTVTDVNGNTATKTAIVTVVGQLPSCSITSVPTSNVFTGGNPDNIYLGYGAQSTVLNVAATGGSSYTYQWSGTATQMLSSTTAAAPVFTPTVPGNYTFMVTVTNNFGCISTCSITICVKDIRVPGTGLKGSPAKVYICHLPPGNKNNPQTLEISVNAVATHIGQHSGDRLGTCAMTPCAEPAPTTVSNALVSKAVVEAEPKTNTEEELKVTVMPNPTRTYFTLKIESKYDAPVNLKVMDALGRIIDIKAKLGANATVEIGHNYNTGSYFAEFIQGNRRKVVQLLKVK